MARQIFFYVFYFRYHFTQKRGNMLIYYTIWASFVSALSKYEMQCISCNSVMCQPTKQEFFQRHSHESKHKLFDIAAFFAISHHAIFDVRQKNTEKFIFHWQKYPVKLYGAIINFLIAEVNSIGIGNTFNDSNSLSRSFLLSVSFAHIRYNTTISPGKFYFSLFSAVAAVMTFIGNDVFQYVIWNWRKWWQTCEFYSCWKKKLLKLNG